MAQSPESFTYDRMDLDGLSTRLLRLHHETKDPVIRCSLFEVSLSYSNLMPYEALSYTWGSQERLDVILVNNQNLFITSNLLYALQQLRLPDQDRILWVDAICINQDDPQEQGHQVEQMGSIFTLAERVLFWLGQTEYAINVLFDSLNLLHKESRRLATRGWSRKDERWAQLWSQVQPETRSLLGHTATEHQKEGLRQLLQRGWFRRVWILQEVGNAKAGVVCCGGKSVPPAMIALAPELLGIKPDRHCQAVFDIMPGRFRLDSWWNEERDLKTLLLKFAASEASDERDKIFALLGLCTQDEVKTKILPNYQKPLPRVLRETFHVLMQHNDMRIDDIRDFMKNFHSLTLLYSQMPQHLQGVSIDEAQPPAFWSKFLDSGSKRDSLVVESTQPEKGAPDKTHFTEAQQLYQTIKTHKSMSMPTIPQEAGSNLKALSTSHSIILVFTNFQYILNVLASYGYWKLWSWLIRYAPAHEERKRRFLNTFSVMTELRREQMLSLLNDHDLDVNANERTCGSLLSIAARDGNRLVAEMLIRRGTDINLSSGDHGTALQVASLRDDTSTIELLFEFDADTNVRGGTYGNALQAASFNGKAATVYLLLRHGANADYRGGKYGSAVQAALAGLKDYDAQKGPRPGV